MVLPDELRTGHWYCDIHHAMLVIMFKRLMPALEGGHGTMSGYFVDTLTLYWLLHCLMEEEGFCHALDRGLIDAAEMDAHATAHLSLMTAWREQVFAPFKAGGRQELVQPAQRFYDSVLAHIARFDQHTYGTASGRDPREHGLEIRHIATSGLPLSPYMAGSADVARMVVPDMAAGFAAHSRAPAAEKPLGQLRTAERIAAAGMRRQFLSALESGRFTGKGGRRSRLADLGLQLVA